MVAVVQGDGIWGLLGHSLCALLGPVDYKVNYNLVAGEGEASFLFKEARRPYITPASGFKAL